MFGETKGREILAYQQTLSYCEKILTGIIETEVDQYHAGLGKLYKWLTTAIAGRKLDIQRRKIATSRAKEDRYQKIEKEEDRKNRRAEHIVEARAAWEEENADEIRAWEVHVDRERRREAGEPVSEHDEDENDGAS